MENREFSKRTWVSQNYSKVDRAESNVGSKASDHLQITLNPSSRSGTSCQCSICIWWSQPVGSILAQKELLTVNHLVKDTAEFVSKLSSWAIRGPTCYFVKGRRQGILYVWRRHQPHKGCLQNPSLRSIVRHHRGRPHTFAQLPIRSL